MCYAEEKKSNRFVLSPWGDRMMGVGGLDWRKNFISMLSQSPQNLCVHSQHFCGINKMKLEEKVSQENAVVLQENSKVWGWLYSFLWPCNTFFTYLSPFRAFRVLNDMWVSEWWRNFNFGGNYTFRPLRVMRIVKWEFIVCVFSSLFIFLDHWREQ